MSMRDQLEEKYGKPHLSYSSLKYALGDMRQWEKYMRGTLFKESDALRFGSLYDCLLLTPNEAPNQYVVIDEEILTKGIKAKNVKATKEYKDRIKVFADTAKETNRVVVSSEDWQRAEDMISRLDQEGLISSMLSTGEAQVMFNEDIDGVPLKGFIDYVHPDFVVDSKSTRSIDKFRYDVNSFCYDIQAYIYTLVTGKKDFYWLVQEKNDPYFPGVVKCTSKTLFAGEMKFNEALNNVQEWISTNRSELPDYARFEV